MPSLCAKGVKSDWKPICCAASCGQCGGDGCMKRPGGARKCCFDGIMGANVTCSSPGHTACVLRHVPDEDGILRYDPNDPDIPVRQFARHSA